MSTQDDIFRINYKSEKYKTIFTNINKIFGDNYLNYISQKRLTHPYLVELFIFLRKYQYFVHYIKINKQLLCSFYKNDEPIQDRILNIKQMLSINEDNICSIKFELLPKFKKSEINFEIPNNVIEFEINFHIKLINEDNKIDICLDKGTEILILNLNEILEKNQIDNINNKLSKLFDLYIEELKEKNFKVLNKFVNYIENFLPSLLTDNLTKKNIENENEEIKKGEEWTQEEQNKLEELLIKYKDIKSLKAKLKKISEEFRTKTLKQISSRYKKLALKSKQKKKDDVKNEEKNEIKEIKKDEQIDGDKEEEKKENINETEYKNIKKSEEEIKKEKEEKKIDKIEDLKNEKKIINEKLPTLELNNKEISSISIKSYDSISSNNSKYYNSLETTEDIINAIIDVYNKNYKEHDLSLLQEKSNDKMSYFINFKKYEEDEDNDDDFEIENEEEESDEEVSNNESNEIKKKNDEILDLCLSTSLQPSISSENLTLIKNILNLGERYQVNLNGVQMTFSIKNGYYKQCYLIGIK